MKTITSLSGLAIEDCEAVVAIGNFDGVHKGHQAVIDDARVVAQKLQKPLAVLTFEPHPRSYFAPDAPAFRLMNSDAKRSRLDRLGIDILYELTFDQDIAAKSAEDFVSDILASRLRAAHVLTGADFRFGKNRGGDAVVLTELCNAHDIGTSIINLVALNDGEVSSTQIRNALSEGRTSDAAEMLGHWHRIEGIVAHGDARGKDLGFPTANLKLDGLHLPRFGVYAVRIDILTGDHAGGYNAVASLGQRPTFGDNAPNFEIHIFDFDGGIYGEHVSVALVEFIRDEEKYDSVDLLINQMHRDASRARSALEHFVAAP